MASCSKRPRQTFTAEEVAEMCTQNDDEAVSDVDSRTGGISSGEEAELDEQLQTATDSETEGR